MDRDKLEPIVQAYIDVVAAVIVDNGSYLACRRNPARGGKWEFPGGKVEAGEDHENALKREILEELGVEIVVGEEVIITTDEQLGIRLTSFTATLVSLRPIASTDHDLLQWFDLAELSGLDWAPADIETVEIVAASAGTM